MRRVAIFAILMLSLASCSKKKCWYCTTDSFTRYFYTTPTLEQNNHYEGKVCEKTEEEIRAHEKENTFYYIDSLQEYGTTVTCK